VYTRRDDDDLPAVVQWRPSVRVLHVTAGPAQRVRKAHLLPLMPAFARGVLAAACDLRDRGRGYSLSHAHFFMSGLVARQLKEALGIPYVVTFHGLGRVRMLYQPNDEHLRQRALLEQLVIEQADAIIAQSPQEETDLLRHYRVPAVRLRMIPCGFDPDEFHAVPRAQARERVGLPPDQPVLLNVGRIVPRKGLDVVIHALAILKRQYGFNPLLLVVGGDAPEPDATMTPEIGRLQSIAAEEGVADEVKFVGHRPRSELGHYYGAADVFVTMAQQETAGMAAIEAMACGLPVIGARVGALRYSVQDGRTGFLVAPGNPDALARRLAHVLSNASLRRVIANRSRRRAYEHFAWPKVVQALVAAYADLVPSLPDARGQPALA
jgi:D-inositol-3-phosphate glycosyltransferase